jgi:hypothetical protein
MKRLFKKSQKPAVVERQRQPVTRQPITSFSYYASKRNEPGIRQESTSRWFVWQKETMKLWGNVTIVIALILTLGAVMYGGTLSQEPKLAITPQANMQYRDKQLYIDTIKGLLNDDMFSRLKISFRKKHISDEIQHSFPETKSVAITIPIIGRRPLIDLVLYKPIAQLSVGTQSYIIDESGRAIVTVDASHQKTDLLQITDLSGLPVAIGSAYIPSEELNFIDLFNKQLHSKDISVTRIELPPVAKEVHFYVGDAGLLIKASMVGDARMEAGSAIALLKEIQAGRVAPPKEYLDVRVEDRVYYK